MNPENPKLRYVVQVIAESTDPLGPKVYAGYVLLERRLVGVAQGISREVVVRLLRKKAEEWGTPLDSQPVSSVVYGRKWRKSLKKNV